MAFFGELFKTDNSKINVVELKEKIQNDKEAFYVDVRTPMEFKTKSIKGFKNIPLDQVPTRLNDFPKDREIVVICQSGGRSSSAQKFLKQNGYEQVTNVSGGMGAWMMHRF